MKDFNKALNHSFLLLKYRDRSKSEIISRLKLKGYDKEVRKQVVEYLEKNKYINDQSFALLFFDYSVEKGWGRRRIEFSLKKLGISPQLCQQVLKIKYNYNKKVSEIIQNKIASYSARKPALSAQKIWRNIVAHLARRGFEYEIIYQEMRNLGVKKFENE